MATELETLALNQASGGVPNSALPLVLYHHVSHEENLAEAFEHLFARNGWPPRWRYPVFTYTHFHSNTHEALGVFAGSAKIQFGGEAGPVVDISRGDAVLIPAGVGHKQIEASEDFMCVGAYPDGFSPDKYLDQPGQLAEVKENIAKVPRPGKDPVTGSREGINTLW
ncbi:cupin [Enterobacteriaceae bacterium H20N1]|uniref:Cupin n=1 Tax=Dryocola boscaweniae TaxID=2925397 RepID=A0A9X2W6W7_9ENTR|nr:cupin [Dryocola boscaweniae]MCT4702218.1 cupin [Dryocola boscaweniae]MCT4714394.1 cupin [Dryocola boscaweniae]MCT4719338.1 cupin [Dryocola boscaweniae]